MSFPRSIRAAAGLSWVTFVAVAVAHVQPAQAQGTIAGTVRSLDTGDPIGAVQISVLGSQLGSLGATDGSFSVLNVPAGTHTITAQRLGFQILRQDNVVVTSGGTVTLQLQMRPAVLALQEIVATGLVDPVQGVRSPISVAHISRENMPVVVAGGALQNLQGRVAGLSMSRASGRPGEDVTILLRTPTTTRISADGSPSAGPLVVVDGVILGGSTVNIESMDIESVEVVRGAAGASMYGSRAAAGVISITTKRGQGLGLGQTQFTATSEIGISQISRRLDLPTHHHYLMDAAQTTYVNAAGTPVSRAQRTSLPWQFQDNAYPGPLYDNLAAVYQPGGFQSHNFSVAQNTASTNFQLSISQYTERGALKGNNGYERGSFRMNLDHRFLDGMSLSTSMFHSRDLRDNVIVTYNQILSVPPDQDMKQKDEDPLSETYGQYIRIVDPEQPYENPLWIQDSQEGNERRIRTLAGTNFQWTPAGVSWLSFMGNVSYDRQDGKTRAYIPKGTPNSLTASTESDGSMSVGSTATDTFNSEVQMSLRHNFDLFGGAVNARTTVRALWESAQDDRHTSTATNFFVESVPRIDLGQIRDATSLREETKAVGYLWDTALDYEGKYITSVLARRDGSSVFGPDNRWHNYYRTAFAWRVAEEPWFN
ncbi:MAG: hypothetical protein EXR92_03290, partial [Gemmatimonadetes bacterium]|nr:hypothetical protein [Gemmatimonadota bacterium]